MKMCTRCYVTKSIQEFIRGQSNRKEYNRCNACSEKEREAYKKSTQIRDLSVEESSREFAIEPDTVETSPQLDIFNSRIAASEESSQVQQGSSITANSVIKNVEYYVEHVEHSKNDSDWNMSPKQRHDSIFGDTGSDISDNTDSEDPVLLNEDDDAVMLSSRETAIGDHDSDSTDSEVSRRNCVITESIPRTPFGNNADGSVFSTPTPTRKIKQQWLGTTKFLKRKHLTKRATYPLAYNVTPQSTTSLYIELYSLRNQLRNVKKQLKVEKQKVANLEANTENYDMEIPQSDIEAHIKVICVLWIYCV
jgi:hypothetical protein